MVSRRQEDELLSEVTEECEPEERRAQVQVKEVDLES
jgi:hypothetical protein